MKVYSPLRFLALILLFCLFSVALHAAFLTNVPLSARQPDGSELSLFATGDEYHFRMHDANGFTVLRNTQGWYVYAVMQDGKPTPGKLIVGQADPKLAGIKPGIDITPEEWKALRAEFWKDTPPSKLANQSPSVTSGTVNNVVVFIRFSDQAAFPSNISTYNSMFNDNTTGVSSMYNYFKEATYNNLNVPSTFYPTPTGSLVLSYQDSHPRNYFVPWDTVTNPIGYKSNQRTAREHDLLRAAITSIASQVPTNLNLDFNNDGDIDNVCFIVRGGTTDWSTLLWPHRWSVYTNPAVYINGKQLYDYNLQLEDHLANSGVGVLAHEMYHTFGAPDLYHYTSNGISPNGSWDVMCSNTNPPQHMSAFMKYKYGGWISSIPTITSPGTYTLNPLTSSTGNCYKIATGASATEYFVLEYRKKTGAFENSLAGSGLIVHRINTMAGNGNADGPPDEVYTYRPNGSLSANGTTSQAFFNSAVGRTAFNDTTNPRCFLSNDSNAHINIYNITAAGNTISFQVSMSPIANFTASILNTCPNQTITFSDISGGAVTSRQWTFTPNNVVFVGGTSASSQYPQVQFTTAGNYTVALAITGPGGSNTMTKSNLIHITSPVPTPFSDNFETGTFATKDWTLINADGQSTWGFSTAASGNGSSATSVWLNFYNYDNSGAIDELVSPGIVIPQSGTVKLKFKVAYRAYSDNYHDSLKVAIYTNCGSSLAGIPYAKGYSDLPTGNDDVNPFTPSVAADWRLDSLDLSAYHGQTIILKFIAVNGYGNNIFLDDINLTTTLGSVIANFSANPTSVCQNGTVSFTDLSVGSPTSWLWNFGDGGTSTLQNPTHQYLSPGYKTVSLTASHTGSSNTHAKNDYIHVNAIPIISLGNDTVIPQSDILTLDAGAGYWAYQWNTGETTQVKQVNSTGTYSVTVASAPGCSGSDAIFVKHGFSDIYGSVSYFNISNSPMDSVLVQLKSGTSVVQSTMVSSGGSFHFTSVSPGTYSLEAFSGKSWGGANATDAMLVLKHFVNIASLSGIKLKAANVDNSAVVNSLDAMLISRRFTGSVSSFPAGNWAFEKPEIVFSGNSDFTQNIKGMCYGDVNGSFFPFSKTSIPQLELQGRAEQDLSGWTLVPLTTDQDLEVGAISMIIDFLSGNYEVSEVKGPACEGSSLDFHFEEGRLNIAWYSLNPVRINAGEPLLVLKVRSLNMASGTFMLQTQSGSELADGNAVAFPEVKLFYPGMSTDDAKALQMRVFPNPSPGVVNLFVEGADNESFRLEISNMLGEVVYTEPYIVFSSGTKHRLDLSPLPAGLYFLSLKGREMSSFVKIVRQAQDLK